MKDLLDVLPGIDMPVSEVARRLDTMWQGDADGSPSEFRASQMNVVLHFGWEVSEEEALERFSALIEFSQRYPSRIIVLCPSKSIRDGSMKAKLFSQCYIGDSHREMCCCEALILGYQPDDCGFLGNQVSVWLESDLPTYHWFNRVPAERIEAYGNDLLVGVRRSIYDSSIEPEDFAGIKWPVPDRVADLAAARLLPVRQAIGQFLSAYSIEQLCHGLQAVRIRHAATKSGEGYRLQQWIKECLGVCPKCEDCSALKADYHLDECNSPDCLLALELSYEGEHYSRWKLLDGENLARIE
ncbi:MAG: glucose-6-phosphate dehydrogenase assembly protein OpcA, partial [Opitutales bacterium]